MNPARILVPAAGTAPAPAALLAVSLFLFPMLVAAQTVGTLNLYPSSSAAEEADLNRAITEANGSSIDLTRALEEYLRKYPDSPRRADIEAQLYKTATETNDDARIVLYGGRLLAGHPSGELEMLDRVIRAFLASDDAESAKTAMGYIQRYKIGVAAMRARPPEGHTTAAQWADLADRAYARATVLEAHAAGNLGNFEDAYAAAKHSWEAQPSAEAAHEMARWLVKLGRDPEAIDHYADAVMIDDSRAPWSERDLDRHTVASLYTNIHGSEEGLGDVFLRAWDRSAAALAARIARYKAIDRNYNVSDMFGFVLPGIAQPAAGELDMGKLRGKTLVIDFWATWCLPCIAEHPLIDHVEKKYAASADVVFLSLDADDDHSLVAPFLKQQNWEQRVYLEGGLAGLLNVASLPTILVVDPSGRIYSRMSGFSTDVFEAMLSTRIDGARSVTPK